MQHAIKDFQSAESNTERYTAAIWLSDAYSLFSSDLPDDISDRDRETISEIGLLLDAGSGSWEMRVRAEFSPDRIVVLDGL